jgi:uncharacterized protein YjbJ (UPF0337 family)
MSGTTLVLDGDGGLTRRPPFEVRFGRPTGQEKVEPINRKEARTMSMEEQAKGKLEEVKGRGEQAQGDLTGDKSKKTEGILDEAKGKLRQEADKVREAVHDARAKHKT